MYPIPVDDFNEHPVLSGTGSSETLNMVRQWLQKCLKEHRKCTKQAPSSKFTPSRLVDVGSHQDKHWKLSTSLDRSTEDEPPYLTLSHQLGSGYFVKLLLSTYNEMRHGQLVSELPKTFQDAIMVTKRLGQRYIWIDSLCIIKDSYEDWLQEASSLRDIYSHSVMNIASLSVSSSETGSFVQRNSGIVKNVVHFCWKDYHHSPHQICSQNLWEESVDKMSLNYQGWVFHERSLVPLKPSLRTNASVLAVFRAKGVRVYA